VLRASPDVEDDVEDKQKPRHNDNRYIVLEIPAIMKIGVIWAKKNNTAKRVIKKISGIK